MIWLRLFLFAGFLLVSEAAAPDISSVPALILRKDLSVDFDSEWIVVSDPENEDFDCTFVADTVPFTKELAKVNAGYLMTVAHEDATALTSAEYTVTVRCNDSNGDIAEEDVTVKITSAPNSEVVPVDVNAVHLPGTILHNVTAPELSGPPLSCSATPPAGFTVDANDCKIRNSVDLRTLTLTSSHSLDIVVSDGVESVTVTRVLSFSNPNAPPVFSGTQDEVAISEDATAGTTVVSFPATDSDSFTRVITVDSDLYLFEIDDANGVVTLKSGNSLDYEAGTTSFIFTCVANDGHQQSTASVTVSVTDANDAPALSPATFAVTVDETAPATLTLSLPFTVTDQDGVTATSHRFSVKPGEAHSQFFGFPDVHKLELTNLLDLDIDTVSPPFPATLHVIATDADGKTATAQVVISLADSNNNDPQFDAASLAMVKVHVDMAQGTLLGEVKASDADTGSNAEIEFSLVEPNPHPGLFSVLANGEVSLAKKLTEAYGTQLQLEVNATDKGVPSRSSTALVTLQWNEAPWITNLPGNAHVLEHLSAETTLFGLVTSDTEGDTVTCRITDVVPAKDGAFVIRGDDVIFTGDVVLDRSTTESYSLTVTASDGKGGQSSQTLVVEVSPNLAPTSSCDGSVQTSVDVQKAKINDEVKTITVTDPENDVISFAVSSTPDSGLFEFDGEKKRVFVARDLIQEAPMTHTVRVDITDGHSIVSCTVVITLTNTVPMFAQHSVSVAVPEDFAAPTPFFQFDVTHTQAFLVQWEVDPPGEFDLFKFDNATREISLNSRKAFDYERTTEYLITCTAYDSAGKSSSSVTISIQNANEPPFLTSDTVYRTVDEGPASSVVFTPDYAAEDPDGDTLTYAVDPAYAALFTIDSITGELTNSQELDRDDGNPEQVPIKVVIQDPSGLSVTADVTIILNDINDNAPEFDKSTYTFYVGLSTKQGLLGTFTTSDKDEGTNADVDVVLKSQSPKGYFDLKPDGRLFLTKDIDLKYKSLITLDVEAVDNGKKSNTGNVVVEVLWKPGPTIDNLPDVVQVMEDEQVKRELLKLKVTKAVQDLVVCELVNISPTSKSFDLELDGEDFKIIYNGQGVLPSTDVKTYTVKTRCYDDDGEDVRILTLRVQANVPPVLACNISVSVDASTKDKNDQVYKIKATDEDVGDSLEYSIDSAIFFVDSRSGIMKAVDNLMKTTKYEDVVTVRVKDTHGQSTFCIINFFLTNVNKAPVFANLEATARITEHPVAGSVLFTVTVTDPNIFGSNIGYVMTSDHVNMFDVSAAGLEIAVKLADGEDFDFESGVLTYTLTFTANDGYLESTEGVLTIMVLPKNEPPAFAQNLLYYAATFKEIADPHEARYLGCNVNDPDANDDVTMSVTGPYSDHFTIDGTTSCQLTLIKEIDLDVRVPHLINLTLVATDNHGATAQAALDVTVEEINDNIPTFAGTASLDIMMYMQPDDVIGTANASDEDIGTSGSLTYSLLESPQNAADYIAFLNTGEFLLKKDMEGVFSAGDQFKYVVHVTDHGDPALTATSSVYVVYRPFLTTTPLDNTTTTIAPNTTTAEVESTTVADDSIWDSSVVIGLMVALAVLALMLIAIFFVLAWKYFCAKPSTTDAYKASRVESPPRNNRVSVAEVESPVTTDYVGRKISRLSPGLPY